MHFQIALTSEKVAGFGRVTCVLFGGFTVVGGAGGAGKKALETF